MVKNFGIRQYSHDNSRFSIPLLKSSVFFFVLFRRLTNRPADVIVSQYDPLLPPFLYLLVRIWREKGRTTTTNSDVNNPIHYPGVPILKLSPYWNETNDQFPKRTKEFFLCVCVWMKRNVIAHLTALIGSVS